METLKNIGPTTMEWLREIGIETRSDLEAIGAVMAYKMLKHRRPQEVTILALYALQGAILDLHWNALPPEVKAQLKRDAQEPLYVQPGS